MNKLEIVKFKKRHNLTSENIAELTGVSVRTVKSWEYGERNISKSALKLLGDYESANLNHNKKDSALLQLQEVRNKKRSDEKGEGRVVNENDLVNAVEIIVPYMGQAGLSSKFYPDEIINEFERREIKVKPQHRGIFYTIEVDGRSMPPLIQPGDWFRCEEISSIYWLEPNFFKPRKIYCIWHNERGIIFKRILYKGSELWCISDNEDKQTYPDFKLDLAVVNKILEVKKLVSRDY